MNKAVYENTNQEKGTRKGLIEEDATRIKPTALQKGVRDTLFEHQFHGRKHKLLQVPTGRLQTREFASSQLFNRRVFFEHFESSLVPGTERESIH